MRVFKLLLFFVLVGCTSTEPDNSILMEDDMGLEENRPPNIFSLLEITDSAVNVELLPSFSWENATDPDGDEVSYQFIFSTDPNPSTILADDLNSASFNITDELSVDTTYYWKVIAVDENQNSRESNTASFTTRSIRLSVNQIMESATFSARSDHTMITFDNKIWIIGGSFKNDVWYSEDGITWNLAVAEAPFSRREFHTSVVFNNKIWVIAGNALDENDVLVPVNDVWSSPDGFNWTLEADNAEFSPRWLHSSLVFDNKIWVINGFGDFTIISDVWYTSDGKEWQLATENPAFEASGLQASFVFEDKMWIMGGNNNTVWSSSDGTDWELVTENAAFTARNISASTVFDNRMWIFGGETSSGDLNDIWYSSDGLNWFMATASPEAYSNRSNHKVEVFNDKVFLSAGRPPSGIGGLNDVWEIVLE